MDRGAWWATVHRISKSWTQLKQLSTQEKKQIFLGTAISQENSIEKTSLSF